LLIGYAIFLIVANVVYMASTAEKALQFRLAPSQIYNFVFTF